MSTNIATASSPAPSPRPSRRGAARAKSYRFMEFCGGHTHAISRYGIEDLLPANVRMIHGPGCPVCVLPVGRMDDAIKLAQRAGRHALHLCRPDARARLERHEPDQGQGGGRRYPHGLFDAGRGAHRAGGAGAQGRVLRHRLRDHDAADRDGDRCAAQRHGLDKFLRLLQSRADARRRSQHILDGPEVARLGSVAHRRLRRPGACLDRDRHQALRVFRRRITASRW